MCPPFMNWFTIRMTLVLSIINRRSTHQVEFILAFFRSNIKFDVYMEIPRGIKTKTEIRMVHVLKLLNNLYGKKKGYRVWNQHLIKGL